MDDKTVQGLQPAAANDATAQTMKTVRADGSQQASNGDMTFDEIMDSWNQAWTEAQELSGVEIKY